MTKYALVTGGSSGIGKEIAVLLAKNHFNLVLVARDKTTLETLAAELEGTYQIDVKTIAIDLSDTSAAKEVFRILEKENISIEILVNNAGFGTAGKFWEIDEAKEIAELQLNIVSLTLLTKYFLPKMVARKSGKILNVSSIAAFLPGPFMNVYFASKAYVYSFSAGLRAELLGTGVTVTVLCPSPTESGFAQRAGVEKSKLFTGNLLTTTAVAKAGYEGMMKGQDVVFSDLKSHLMTYVIKFVPLSILAKAVKLSTRP